MHIFTMNISEMVTISIKEQVMYVLSIGVIKFDPCQF